MDRREFLQVMAFGCMIGQEAANAGSTDQKVSIPVNSKFARKLLSEHRIQKIEARLLQDQYPRLVGRNARLGHHGRGGQYQIRILTTDKGVRGWGMSHGPDE